MADVWLPRFWPVAVIVSSLFARRHDATQLRRATETLQAPLTRAAEYVGDRDRKAAEREARLLALTVTLARLTRVVLVLAAATLAVAVVTLAVA